MKLTKRDIPGEAAYREVCRQLSIRRSQLTDHGLKDSHAITAQLVVIEGKYQPSFASDRIWLQQQGVYHNPLKKGKRGIHRGNRFIIHVKTNEVVAPRGDEFLNLFGRQRFGEGSYETGRLLLEGDLDRAVSYLRELRDWRLIQQICNRYRCSETEALRHPKFAYEAGFKVMQFGSYLWNQMAPQVEANWLPMWSMDHKLLYRDLWSPRNLDPYFIAMMHSFRRKVWVRARDQQIEKTEAGFTHQFTIWSGVYATVFLNSLYDLVDASQRS